MPNNYTTDETRRLIGDIHNLTITSRKCDTGSGCEIEKTLSSLRALGYTSSKLIDYYQTSNYLVVENELRSRRPVLFRGGHKEIKFLIFPVYEGGHQWVCDGFEYTWNCQCGFLKLYMNWGYGGIYNGWYGFNSFNPGGKDFNYQTKVIINIHP